MISAILFFVKISHANAADLINTRDTLSTSRPSAASPFTSNAASNDRTITILNNGSFYLASDSAQIIRHSTGTILATDIPISSQSAGLSTIYLGDDIGTNTTSGDDILLVPITSTHTIRFTTASEIPAGGDILLTFPGAANNSASPSATTFAFNGLNSTGGLPGGISSHNISCNTNSFVFSPQIMCETTGSVPAGTTITILIGCTAQSGGNCTTQSPTLINPTKTTTTGTADIWKIFIQTRDATDIELDSATVAIGTIDSVTVRASIDPSLTFAITGIGNGSAVNLGNTTGCLQTEITNSGLNSTATEINLGLLADTPSGIDVRVGNIAAQRINISTNAANGYTLSATSSGQLINPTTGFFLASSTTPTAFPSNSSDWFGIHPCGLDVTTATWNSTASTSCNTYISGSTDPICLYAWPTQSAPLTLASDAVGPIGNSLVTGNGVISVAYAASTDAGVPPGSYSTVITYTATPVF